jgi:hypothetical protein
LTLKKHITSHGRIACAPSDLSDEKAMKYKYLIKSQLTVSQCLLALMS